MIWFVMILTMILAVLPQLWSEWGFRLFVISSLGANVVLGLVSGTRRRSASGWRAKGQLALVFILWFAYQVAELATTSAIGSLSLCGSDASEEEKQVVAFWAPLLLLHLGGPDNLTAYAVEDNKISKRKWLEMVTNILGVSYTIYKNTHRGGHSWALLLAASVIMLVAGAARFVERVNALRKANLDNMQQDASSSSKKTPREAAGSSGCYNSSSRSSSSSTAGTEDDVKMVELKSRIKRKQGRGWPLRDGEALLLAQDLFPIWRHALVDSSVDPKSKRQHASEIIILSQDWDWESMCKVAEMELSLIYEFLYTKAILAHTWYYYLIRFLSPLFTAAAALLFWFWLHGDQQQQQGDVIRGSFVRITYALLGITFLMDVAWLLRALGSTWAYAYLREQAPAWLRHQALHAAGGRWCSLHRIVVRLDPLQLFCRDPVSYRLWSGTIGRYNLLDECTTTHRSQCPEWLVSMAGDSPKEIRYLSKLPQCVKKVLFERVREILKQAIDNKDRKQEKYTMVDIRMHWGHKAFRTSGIFILPDVDEATIFGEEFEEDVLSWHIATCIVLPHIRQQGIPAQSQAHARAIEVMSEYMMFLVAVRRQMLPGLVLHSQLKLTYEALEELWVKHKGEHPEAESNKEELALILRRISREKTSDKDQELDLNEGTDLLANAVELFSLLAGEKRAEGESRAPPPPVPKLLLEFIFNVWVDKLVYAAVRCSREAHAKQLCAGGDLTTVLWMLIQHAGPFRMGETKPIYIKPHDEKRKKEEGKKDKKPEEKKGTEEKGKKEGKKPEEKKPEVPAAPPAPAPYFGFYPSYPPMWPPSCYDPSWTPMCPWYPQWHPQHEKPGDEPEEAREDEDEDSSDEDSEE